MLFFKHKKSRSPAAPEVPNRIMRDSGQVDLPLGFIQLRGFPECAPLSGVLECIPLRAPGHKYFPECALLHSKNYWSEFRSMKDLLVEKFGGPGDVKFFFSKSPFLPKKNQYRRGAEKRSRFRNVCSSLRPDQLVRIPLYSAPFRSVQTLLTIPF